MDIRFKKLDDSCVEIKDNDTGNMLSVWKINDTITFSYDGEYEEFGQFVFPKNNPLFSVFAKYMTEGEDLVFFSEDKYLESPRAIYPGLANSVILTRRENVIIFDFYVDVLDRDGTAIDNSVVFSEGNLSNYEIFKIGDELIASIPMSKEKTKMK